MAEIKKYEELEFTDDFMFSKVMYNNKKLCAAIISLILGKKVRKIEYPEVQKTVDVSYDARGVRFDVYAEGEKEAYDIEMQVVAGKDIAKRSRYYHGMIGMGMLEKGASYKELKESYVIFICKKGLKGYGNKAVTSFQNRCDQDAKVLLKDGTHTIFVNAEGKCTSKEEKAFLEYVGKGKVREETPLVKMIESAVEEFREHKKWRIEYMTLQMKYDEYEAKGMAKGMALGEKRGIALGVGNTAMAMLKEGLSVDMVSKITGLSKKDIAEMSRKK